MTRRSVAERNARLAVDAANSYREHLARATEALDVLEAKMRDYADLHASFYTQTNEGLRARPGEVFDVTPYGHPGLHYDNSTPDFADRGSRAQPQFFCAVCSTSWPCKPYLWATGSEPFQLVVWPKATRWIDPEQDKAVTEAAPDHKAILLASEHILSEVATPLLQQITLLADEYGMYGVMQVSQTMFEQQRARRALEKARADAAQGEDADTGERSRD